MVGPDYKRPPPADPPSLAFKETTGPVVGAAANFQPAMPRDAIDRGPWWSMYGDPTLDRLAAQIDISNQTLMQAEAAYRQARALVRQDASGLYPTVTGSAGYTQSGSGSGSRAQSSGTCVNRKLRQRRPVHAPARRSTGRSTCGAASAARSRAIRRRPRPAPPTSPMPGCRRRPTWRSTTSPCASPSSACGSTRRRWRPTRARSRSCRTSSMPAS